MKKQIETVEEVKRVGIWLRVSTEDQVRGESLEHHEKRARLYAEAKGWEVVKVYQLNAVSGKTVKETPQAQAMMRDVQDGVITGLIFSKLARLARNTKELLDFSEFFRKHGAELISLGESIDTSTPAGRLFYTMIAGMATWERDEIAARVAASVPIRAKLGKNIGGAAPFGYVWKDGKCQIDEREKPIRLEMYEIFLQCERLKATAKIMNERGYRTRSGGKFTDSTIRRLLEDPIAKGVRVLGQKSRILESTHLSQQPQENTLSFPIEPILSNEMWDLVQTTLRQRAISPKKVTKRVVQLFAGYTHCDCGSKMYVKYQSKKYACLECLNKIPVADLEAIFHEQLRNFFFSPEEIAKQLATSTNAIRDKEALLSTLGNELKRLESEIDKAYVLFHDSIIDKRAFADRYRPLEARKRQLDEEIPTLQAELDVLQITQLSHEDIVVGAKDLYTRWPDLAHEEKRRIVEAITKRITIGKEEVSIDLLYEPSREELAPLNGGGGTSGGNESGRSTGGAFASTKQGVNALPATLLNHGKWATNSPHRNALHGEFVGPFVQTALLIELRERFCRVRRERERRFTLLFASNDVRRTN
jgi:site-specific DNA recombinase